MRTGKSKNCFISLLTFISLIVLLPIMLVSCGGGASSTSGGGASSTAISSVVLSDIAPKSTSSTTLPALLAAKSSSYQVPVGGSKQFYAYAVYKDNSVVNISSSELQLNYTPKGYFTVNKLAISSVPKKEDIGESNTFTVSYQSIQSNPITVSVADPSTFIANICISNSVRTSASDPCATGSYRIPYGKFSRFYVYANYGDNHVVDITNSADTKWNLGQNGDIISINDGLVASSAKDKSYISKATTVTASYNDYTSSPVSISISGAVPTGVCLSNVAPNSGNATPCSNVPESYSIPYGGSQQVYAYESYNDGSYVDVTTLPGLTWSLGQSSNIISIQDGLITSAAGAGYAGQSTAITASYDKFTSNGVSISISNAVPTGVCISNVAPNSGNATPCANAPESYSIPYLGSQQAYVYEMYNDGSYVDVTTSSGLTWSLGQSSDIISSPIQGGLITSVAGVGYAGQSTTITASYDNFTSSGVSIAINSAAPTNICVSNINVASGSGSNPCSGAPESYSIPYGGSKQVYAYENYNDGSFVNITNNPNLSWNLGQSSQIITMNGGNITSSTAGAYTGDSTSITASYNDLTSSGVLISIADHVITSITLNPDPQQESAVASLPYNLSIAAVYSDNTTESLAGNDPNLSFTSDHSDSLSFNAGIMTASNVSESFVATVTATYTSPVSGITVQPATIQISVYPKQLILQWGNPVYNFLITSDPAPIIYSEVSGGYYYLGVVMYSNWENTAHMQWVSYDNVEVQSNSDLIVYSTDNPGLHKCQDFTVTSRKSLKQCQYFTVASGVVGASDLSLTFTDKADPDHTTKTIGVTFH